MIPDELLEDESQNIDRMADPIGKFMASGGEVPEDSPDVEAEVEKYPTAQPGMAESITRNRMKDKLLAAIAKAGEVAQPVDLAKGVEPSPQAQGKAAEPAMPEPPQAPAEPPQAAPPAPAPPDAPEAQPGPSMPAPGSLPQAEAAQAPPPPPEPPKEPWARMQHDLRENETRPPPVGDLEAKMGEVGWKPKAGTAGGLDVDWEALQNDIQRAERGKDTTKLVNAALAGAGTGQVFHPPSDAGEGEAAAARAPLDVMKSRLAFEEQQRKADADLLAKHKAAELDDPNSAVSKRAQEDFAQKFGGDSRLVPAGLKQMSANEIKALTGTATSLTGQKNSADIAKANKEAAASLERAKADERNKDDAVKQAEAERKRGEEAESVKSQRAILKKDPDAKKLGFTPEEIDGLDRKGIEDVYKRIDDFKSKGGKGSGGGKPANIKAGDINSVPERRPGYRNMIAAIARGDAPAPAPGAKVAGQEVISDVYAFKPDFKSSTYGQGADAEKQVAHNVKIRNARTAKKHFQMALESVPNNFDANSINRINNYIKNQKGDPGITEFETAVAIGAGELAKGLGDNAEAGKEQIRHLLSPNQSKAQIIKRLNTLIKLQDEAIGTEREAFESAAPGRQLPAILREDGGEAKKDHGSVVRETKSFKQYEDGFIERKAP